jgi:hypothetical protein
VPRLEVGRFVPIPCEVEVEPVLVLLQDDPQPPQSLQDLDAERPDARVAAVSAELARRADHAVHGAVVHDREGVGHAEVRVLPQAGDQHQPGIRREAVEVGPVVEVAVARADVPHGLGDLVDRELVEG